MKLTRVIIAFCLLFSLLLSTTSAVTADTGGSDEFSPNHILVKFKDWADEGIKRQIHGKHGGSVTDSIPQIGVQIVRTPSRVWEKVKAYSGEAAVQYAEPDYIARVIPSDPFYQQGEQWGIDKIQAPLAWDETTGSPDIRIAILDTGIDQDHEDLASKIVANKKFARTSRTVDDFYGHGTHVAGIAAALTNNGIGVAGVGYDCSILNGKVLSDNGLGWYSWIAKGITWAADNGAKVINLSLGGPLPNSALEDAVNYAWNKGVVVVAAAGNENTNAPVYPAYYTNCIAVAATDDSDSRAVFSNYGDWVDVAAPGVDILSTFPNHENYWGDIFNYAYWGGTSMATPHVAGLAGLIWATSYGTDNASVRTRIESTADEVGNIWTGYGIRRVNAYEAVAPAGTNSPPVADDKSVTTNEDTPVIVQLTGSDENGDELTFSIVEDPSNGTLGAITNYQYDFLTGIPTADVPYTPNVNYIGPDSFAYRAHDGKAFSNVANVSITVNPVNDQPVANDDVASTTVDTQVSIPVLANDSDVDGDTLSVISVTSPASGTAVIEADNTITYTPSSGFTGTDTFDYSISDGHGGSDTATVIVTVHETANTMHVGDLESKGVKLQKGYWKALITITVHDAGHNLLAGAKVTGTFYQNGTFVGEVSGTTAADGTCTVDSGSFPSKSGKATFTVDNVTHTEPTYEYEPTANHDADGDSDGTTIGISK